MLKRLSPMLALLVVVLLPSAAQADETSAPSLLALAGFAQQFWPQSPCAGREQISYSTEIAGPDLGQAWPSECRAAIRPGLPPMTACAVLTHELGHDALGPTYFQAVNPSDPAHSPDPHNIMYAAQESFPPCERRFGSADQWLAVAHDQLVSEGNPRCEWYGYRKKRATFRCLDGDGERLRLSIGMWREVAISPETR